MSDLVARTGRNLNPPTFHQTATPIAVGKIRKTTLAFQDFEKTGNQRKIFQKIKWKSTNDLPEKKWNSIRDLPERK